MCATTEGEAYIEGSIQRQCTLCPHMVWVSPGGLELAEKTRVACNCCVQKIAGGLRRDPAAA